MIKHNTDRQLRHSRGQYADTSYRQPMKMEWRFLSLMTSYIQPMRLEGMFLYLHVIQTSNTGLGEVPYTYTSYKHPMRM